MVCSDAYYDVIMSDCMMNAECSSGNFYRDIFFEYTMYMNTMNILYVCMHCTNILHL